MSTEHRLDWRGKKLFCGVAELADDEFKAARTMLALGMAKRADRITTYRGEMACLTGEVGWLADHTVRETATEGPRFDLWKPFPAARRRPQTGKTEF